MGPWGLFTHMICRTWFGLVLEKQLHHSITAAPGCSNETGGPVLPGKKSKGHDHESKDHDLFGAWTHDGVGGLVSNMKI